MVRYARRRIRERATRSVRRSDGRNLCVRTRHPRPRRSLRRSFIGTACKARRIRFSNQEHSQLPAYESHSPPRSLQNPRSWCRRPRRRQPALGRRARSRANALPPTPRTARSASRTASSSCRRCPTTTPRWNPPSTRQTMKLHHDIHHAAYVKGGEHRAGSARGHRRGHRRRGADRPLEQRTRLPRQRPRPAHDVLEQHETKGGSAPTGALADAIKAGFGGQERSRKLFAATAAAVQGSGWAILGYDALSKRLQVIQAEKHQNQTCRASRRSSRSTCGSTPTT